MPLSNMQTFGFSETELSGLFPYFIAVNNEGVVIGFGNNLPNVCGIKKGVRFAEFFVPKHKFDNIPLEFSSVIPINQPLTLQPIDAPAVQMLGKFHYLAQNEAYIFIGTPDYRMADGEAHPATPPIPGPAPVEPMVGREQSGTQRIFDDLEAGIRYFQQEEEILLASGGAEDKNRLAITLSGTDGTILWCNSGFQNMCGYSLDEVKGKRPREAMYGKRSVFIAKDYVDANVREGKPFYFENIGYTKQGTDFWFGVIVSPLFNPKREIIGRIHSIKDITTRKLKALQLEENDHILKMAIDAARAGIWTYDRSSREFTTSEICREMLGLDPDTPFSLKTLFRRAHPDDMSWFSNNVLPKITFQEPSFVFEHRIKVGGVYKYFNARAKCIQWNSRGEPVKLVGTLRDIDSDKNHLLELQKQRKFYYDILDRIPAEIVLWNRDYEYIFANKSAVADDSVRFTMIGKNDFDLCRIVGMAPKVAEDRQDAIKRVLTDKRQTHYIEAGAVGNEVRYNLRVFSPLTHHVNDIDLIIGYAVDITEQVRNEQYAKLQERRLQNIFDIAKDGLFFSDFDGTISTYNASFKKIMNVRAPGFSELRLFDLLPQTARALFKEKIQTLRNTGAMQNGIFSFRAPPADTQVDKFLDFSIAPAVRPEDNGFLCRISDVTEVVEKEKNLRQTINKEVELNNSKTKFIHIASHELRTPLTIIQSNAEMIGLLLERPDLTAKKDPMDLTRKIVKEVSVMTDILNQLMIIGKVESGKLDISKEWVEVNSYLNQMVHDSFSPYTDGRCLETHVLPEPTSWNFDPKLLRHALVNLITNAFKYSANRLPPQLTAQIVQNRLVLEVSDFGIGIPQNEIDSLFQSFYRASNVGGISGTGIGLIVVDYAVKKHGGNLEIATAQNEGSTFTITLPE